MKKLFIIGLLSALFLGFTSCDKDDDAPLLGANVKVTVKNWPGASKDGVTVYMYDKEVTSSTTKGDAKKQVVTDANGVADFDITFSKLNIIESQTSLYFAVFYTVGSTETVAGSSGITVERNKSYNVDVVIPL